MSGFTRTLTITILIDLVAIAMTLEPVSRDITLSSMLREAGIPVASFGLPEVVLFIEFLALVVMLAYGLLRGRRQRSNTRTT